MVCVGTKDLWDSSLGGHIMVLENDSELEPAVLQGRREQEWARI